MKIQSITITLTEQEAFMIDKALGNETLTEEIGQGEYANSWLAVWRRINKKLREAGADVEEA